MLNGDGNENGNKISTSIAKKTNFARAAHFFCTFVFRCFARIQCRFARLKHENS